MKLEIFNEDTVNEQPVILRLVQTEGRVRLVAVDKDGNVVVSGALLSINDEGYIALHTNVNEDLGFKLDDAGRIQSKQ